MFLAMVPLSISAEADEFEELSVGEEHELLIPIKQKLNWLTYDRINVNKRFGTWTETRIKQFQRDYGLEDTGIIDLITYEKLNEVFDQVFIERSENHPGVIKFKESLTHVGFGGMNINEIYGS